MVPFYGIILRKEAMRLGQSNNFWKEPLTFEVVDFPSIYHALFGRPCFTKFMAVTNYTYLKLKIPGLNRVITIEGTFELAYYYKQECVVCPSDRTICPL
jgi:hypothetical protein